MLTSPYSSGNVTRRSYSAGAQRPFPRKVGVGSPQQMPVGPFSSDTSRCHWVPTEQLEPFCNARNRILPAMSCQPSAEFLLPSVVKTRAERISVARAMILGRSDGIWNVVPNVFHKRACWRGCVWLQRLFVPVNVFIDMCRPLCPCHSGRANILVVNEALHRSPGLRTAEHCAVWTSKVRGSVHTRHDRVSRGILMKLDDDLNCAWQD